MKNTIQTDKAKPKEVERNKTIAVIGANYRTSSMSLRDRLFISKTDLGFFYTKLAERGFEECIILSTTDLTEIILCVPSDMGENQTTEIIALLSAHAGEPRNKIENQTFFLVGYDAIKHVFALAAALDNLVIGDEKLKDELNLASQLSIDNHASSQILVDLLHWAQKTAKRISRETQIDKRPISITAAAVQVARDLHGHLKHNSGLLIGGGEMGESLASGMRSSGLKNLIVCHQSSVRAENISKNLNCHAAEFAKLEPLLIQSDIVITSINTRKFVLNKKILQQTIRQRRRKPIFIIDTGVPGDVDPNVVSLEDVFLYTLDDLERVTKEGRDSRANEAELAWKIIEEEAANIAPYMINVRSQTWIENPKITDIDKIREEILQEDGINASKATKLLVSRIKQITNIFDN